MAPETGRWLSTDPPVTAPDAKFMLAPWTLHPYQYASQNPAFYWDPSGNDVFPVPANQPPVWSPTPVPPAPAVAEATATAAGTRAGFGVFAASTAAFLTVVLWPTTGGIETCEPANACGKRDTEQRRKEPVTVNLDTGTIIAATQLKNGWLALGVNAYLADKRVVVTAAVLKEFKNGSLNAAGPIERLLVGAFMLRVEEIPNNPSDRVKNLPSASASQRKKMGEVDREAFGTADRLGIKTLTGDDKFPKAAERYGVVLDVLVHPPARYSGT